MDLREAQPLRSSVACVCGLRKPCRTRASRAAHDHRAAGAPQGIREDEAGTAGFHDRRRLADDGHWHRKHQGPWFPNMRLCRLNRVTTNDCNSPGRGWFAGAWFSLCFRMASVWLCRMYVSAPLRQAPTRRTACSDCLQHDRGRAHHQPLCRAAANSWSTTSSLTVAIELGATAGAGRARHEKRPPRFRCR